MVLTSGAVTYSCLLFGRKLLRQYFLLLEVEIKFEDCNISRVYALSLRKIK